MGSHGCENLIDYEASIQKLIRHIRYLRNEKKNEEDFRPPGPLNKRIDLALTYPDSRLRNFDKFRLETLSEVLGTTLNMLEFHWYEFALEDGFNADPVERGDDGWPIAVPSEYSNQGSYKALLWELRRLKDVCNASMNEVSETPPCAQIAARVLLHIRYECDYPRPRKYNKGPEVQELKRICEAAGADLSEERLRGILADELEIFDPLYCEYNDFLVWIQ